MYACLVIIQIYLIDSISYQRVYIFFIWQLIRNSVRIFVSLLQALTYCCQGLSLQDHQFVAVSRTNTLLVPLVIGKKW